MAGQDTPTDFPQGCAIVFGGSGGLGQGIARILARQGVDLVLTYYSRPDGATELAENLQASGRKVSVLKCDTTNYDEVAHVFESALASHGRVHTVVSSTGLVFNVGPLSETDPASFRRVIETDVIGFFNISRAAVPALKSGGGGSITAIVTPAISRTVPADAQSGVPKAAVALMVKHLAAEHGADGIRANAVGAGVINAGVTAVMRVGQAKEMFDFASSITPLGRDGEADEIGELVTFLASNRAAFVSGQVIHADGALTA